MIYAAYFLMVIGGVVVLLGAIFGVGVAVEAFLVWIKQPNIKSFGEGFDDARNRLKNDSWWFSESPETMRLLQDLADGRGASEARERWRQSRKASEQSTDQSIGTLDTSDLPAGDGSDTWEQPA